LIAYNKSKLAIELLEQFSKQRDIKQKEMLSAAANLASGLHITIHHRLRLEGTEATAGGTEYVRMLYLTSHLWHRVGDLKRT
jgi:hypothetical protein